MAKVVEEKGGKIHTSTPVSSLWIEDKTVRGVRLDNGEAVPADVVIVNADFAHAMSHLVEPGILKKYSRENLGKRGYSCSTFMIYLGVKKRYDMDHHTVVFAKDYRTNVKNIFQDRTLSDDLSFYVQNASVTDPTVAPKGSPPSISSSPSATGWGRQTGPRKGSPSSTRSWISWRDARP